MELTQGCWNRLHRLLLCKNRYAAERWLSSFPNGALGSESAVFGSPAVGIPSSDAVLQLDAKEGKASSAPSLCFLHNVVDRPSWVTGALFPLRRWEGDWGRRHFHHSQAQASEAQRDTHAGILNTVKDMIGHCNMLRSQGSHLEAEQILDTAFQAASLDESPLSVEALWRIWLARAALHWDRCDYKAAVEAANQSRELLEGGKQNVPMMDASMYIIRCLCQVLPTTSAKNVEGGAKECDFQGGVKSNTTDQGNVKGDEEFRGDPWQVTVAAGPFLEPREQELAATLVHANDVLRRADVERDDVARDLLNGALNSLGNLVEDGSAISGKDHPRVALVFSALGQVYAKLARVAGEGQKIFAEGCYKQALKILENPRVSSFGAYSEAVDLTKARLADLLRGIPHRSSEGDRIASEVKDRRLLDAETSKHASIHGLEGRISWS